MRKRKPKLFSICCLRYLCVCLHLHSCLTILSTICYLWYDLVLCFRHFASFNVLFTLISFSWSAFVMCLDFVMVVLVIELCCSTNNNDHNTHIKNERISAYWIACSSLPSSFECSSSIDVVDSSFLPSHQSLPLHHQNYSIEREGLIYCLGAFNKCSSYSFCLGNKSERRGNTRSFLSSVYDRAWLPPGVLPIHPETIGK